MKELKNLEAIRELLASPPIYTYDYSDGLLINKEDTNIQVYSIDLEDEPFAAYISAFIMLSKNGNQTTGKQKSSNNLQYQNYLTN